MRTLNTKKVGKKNLLPRTKSYHFFTNLLFSLVLSHHVRLQPFHCSFFSRSLFSVYCSQLFSCETILWILQNLQIDMLSIIKKIHSNIYLLHCLSVIHFCYISLWAFYSRIYSHFSFEKFYSHNIFTTLSQQILSNRLLLAVIGEQKSNFSGGLKFEPIAIYHLWFIVKLLWKSYLSHFFS